MAALVNGWPVPCRVTESGVAVLEMSSTPRAPVSWTTYLINRTPEVIRAIVSEGSPYLNFIQPEAVSRTTYGMLKSVSVAGAGGSGLTEPLVHVAQPGAPCSTTRGGVSALQLLR